MMSQNYVKKRKLQYAYVTHVNGRKKTVKKSYKPEEIPCIKESLPSTLPSTPVIEEERIEVSDENININKYAKAKHQRISNWTETYNKLVSYAKEKEAVNTLNCHDCGIRCEDLYRCIDCISWPVICGSCLDLRHQHPHLHVFEKWMHGAFIGYAPPTLPWKGKQHQLCTTSYLKEIVVIDDKGRQHLRTIQFCSCEDEAVTLLSYNLWPASPKTPHLAFHMDLLRWLNGLLLECHVSVKGFCEALKARQPKLYKMLVTKEGKEIYKSLMAETIHHFRQYVYQMDYMTDYYPDLDDGCNCPACFEAETSIFCFDADFQLVRKSSSGYNWIAPKHEDRFFVQQKLVDDFIKDYNTPKIEKDCSDFQAGNDIRSKAKNNKLSETAVFGATCRHDFPQKFFSLKHGEKLGYAVFLLELLLKKNSDRQMHISYDIACLLKKHLEKAGRNDLLEKLTFSVPIFHCYGHSISCQILLGPRRTENHGLTDGEGIERLWSYLGGFSTITKEMTPENRTDLLTDGLIYFGQKIRDKIGDTLVMKIKRTAKIEENSDGALQEIISTIPDKRTCMTEDLLKLLIKTDRYCDGQPRKYADRPAFLAYAKTSPKLGSVILFEDVATNVGKHYSPSTGVFTAPHNGLYSLGCMIVSSGKHYVHYQWMKNNAFFSTGFAAKTDHANSNSQNIVLDLKKGDQITIKLAGGGAIHGGRQSYITGYLL